MSFYLVLDLLWLARIVGQELEAGTLSGRTACNLAVMLVSDQKSVNAMERVLRGNRTETNCSVHFDDRQDEALSAAGAHAQPPRQLNALILYSCSIYIR